MTAGPAPHQGWTITRLGAVGSTNDEAKRRAFDGAAHGTVIAAEAQTAGRGRDGRTWSSPSGNLYASLILRPAVALRDAAALSFAAALALGDGLDMLVPLNTTIAFKWPNDVLVNGCKIAGILLEAEAQGAALDFLVIGLGVNCASHPERQREGSTTPATDLKAVIGTAPAPAAVLDAFLGAFALWYERWRAGGLAPLREAWLGRAAGLGETLRVRTARETLHGRFEGLDAGGALVLRTEAGERRIAAGDVYFADR
jgi:BirA family biotin operon repressor/biotin-[acetyl-CoA-carboxylase] ligase